MNLFCKGYLATLIIKTLNDERMDETKPILSVNTKVIRIATGQRAIIVATKEVPYEPERDLYNRKKILSENGYLIYLVKEIQDDRVEFQGSVDVYEHEVEKYNW